MGPLVLSLFDLTGTMVEPWREAGYETLCIDIQRDGTDIRQWLPPRREYRIVFAFPPCTDLAVSGARWFKDKGLAGLASAIEFGTLASYWRKPDHVFHPWEFAGFEEQDNYTKETCLWCGNGFMMPHAFPLQNHLPPDDRIHKAAPGPQRANFRSATPMGFARAVFQANERRGQR